MAGCAVAIGGGEGVDDGGEDGGRGVVCDGLERRGGDVRGGLGGCQEDDCFRREWKVFRKFRCVLGECDVNKRFLE